MTMKDSWESGDSYECYMGRWSRLVADFFIDWLSPSSGLKFDKAGFVDIETTSIEINTYFRDFDDYWKPFLGGQGPAPYFVLSLDQGKKNKLRQTLKARLPTRPDGSISMPARAWAAKGRRSQ